MMLDLLFNAPRLTASLILAGAAFLLALIVRAIQGQGPRALLGGVEAAAVSLAGAWVAQLTLGLVLALGDGGEGVQTLASLLFLIWPGLINLGALAFGQGPVFDAQAILWFALAVGAVAGAFDGFRRIHRWAGPGVLTFLLDYSWGLGLTVNALLLHLVNLVWGNPQDEPRRGAHRYASGFRLGPGFAFTQGNVFSNLGVGPGTGLYRHEMTHVWQNRIFGPFFWITYFGWIILLGAIALIALAFTFRRQNAAAVMMWWPYFNNPWELWAYTHNPTGRTGALPPGGRAGWFDWPLPVKIITSAVVMAAMVAGIVIAIWQVMGG